MIVLVTGGAGFIGTNLIKKLLSNKHEIVSIDNYSTGLETNHQHGVRYINEDIREIKHYNIYGKFDVVYHLAAIARIQPSFVNPIDYFETNTNGTLNVVNHCSKYDIPLIYAGSSSHHSGKFKNPYTFSKDIGEDIIKLYQEHFNLRCSIARFYNVYGPHQLKEGIYSTVIGRWEKQYEDNLPLTIYGDGSKRRDFTHVDDIVDGLVRIKDKESWGLTFELGRGESHTLNDVANMFKKDKIYFEDKLGEAQESVCESMLTRLILDWKPKISLSDYIGSFKNKKGTL